MPATERTPLKGDAAPRRHWSSICCYSSREGALWCTLTLIGITSLLRSGVNTALYPAQQTEFTQRGFKEAVTLWPGIGTAFYALGKLSQIIVIDRLGVYSTCCICLFMSTLGTFITVSEVQILLSAGVALNNFANGHMWGVGIRLLANWVPGEHMGTAISFALGACLDAATIIFGFVLSAMQAALKPEGSWGATYAPFLVFGGMLAFHTVVNVVFLSGSAQEAGFEPPSSIPARQGSPKEALPPTEHSKEGNQALKSGPDVMDTEAAVTEAPHPLDGADVGEALSIFFSDGRVHLGIALSTFFAMSTAFMANFGASFGEALGFDDSQASLLLTAGGLGSLVADLVSGPAADRLSRVTFRRMGYLLQLLGAVSWIGILVLWMGRHASNGLALLRAFTPVAIALIGLPVGLYWGVVIAIFSVRFGGPEHASTLAGLMDLISFIGTIPIQFVYGSLAASSSWLTALAISMSLFLCALICINLHEHLEERLPSLPTVQPHASAGDAAK